LSRKPIGLPVKEGVMSYPLSKTLSAKLENNAFTRAANEYNEYIRDGHNLGRWISHRVNKVRREKEKNALISAGSAR
jgi:hypothetical protein